MNRVRSRSSVAQRPKPCVSKCSSIRSTKLLFSSAVSKAGMNSIPAGSRLIRAKGSRSAASQGRRINRSVLRIVVDFMVARKQCEKAIVSVVDRAQRAKKLDSPYNSIREMHLMRRVYCDANATTPLLPEVMEAMRPYWMEHFGNASSIHIHGQAAHRAVDQARETLARFFKCREAEVVFNSGGTEGDNTALFGLLRPGDHFVTTSIEHSAILDAAGRLALLGIETTFVAPRPSGLIDPAEILRAIRPHTRLISVMLANNETRVVQPIEE